MRRQPLQRVVLRARPKRPFDSIRGWRKWRWLAQRERARLRPQGPSGIRWSSRWAAGHCAPPKCVYRATARRHAACHRWSTKPPTTNRCRGGPSPARLSVHCGWRRCAWKGMTRRIPTPPGSWLSRWRRSGQSPVNRCRARGWGVGKRARRLVLQGRSRSNSHRQRPSQVGC